MYPKKAAIVISIGLGLAWLGAVACGPSSAEIDQLIERRVVEVLASRPAPTPAPTPSPIPTTTPAPTTTPQPTPTPVIFQIQPTATPQPIADFNAVHESAANAVFMVTTPNSIGTGWLIDSGLILTNEHALNGSTTVTVRQANQRSFIATVVASDSLRDIALLKFSPEVVQLAAGTRPLPLGQISEDNIAEPLMAMGYSGTDTDGIQSVGAPTANVGVLSQIVDLRSRSLGLNLVMDVPIDPGDSGGPVFNAKGEVVGMARAVLERTDRGQRVVGTFYAVHIDEIRKALPALESGESR